MQQLIINYVAFKKTQNLREEEINEFFSKITAFPPDDDRMQRDAGSARSQANEFIADIAHERFPFPTFPRVFAVRLDYF